MMKLNKGLQSVLLAGAMMLAIPTGTTKTQQAPASTVVRSFVSQHKAACILAGIIFAAHARLHTRRTEKVPFKMDDLKQDFQDLLDSLDIFDVKLYKQLLFLFDKYIIGLPLKLDEAVRILPKDEDGEILKIKGKKLMQKPFGAYGLFDAYVIKQAEKFFESIGAAGLLFMYFKFPVEAWLGQLDKAQKDHHSIGNNEIAKEVEKTPNMDKNKVAV